MSTKIKRKEFIANKVHKVSDTDKIKMQGAIIEFKNRIVAKYLTD